MSDLHAVCTAATLTECEADVLGLICEYEPRRDWGQSATLAAAEALRGQDLACVRRDGKIIPTRWGLRVARELFSEQVADHV